MADATTEPYEGIRRTIALYSQLMDDRRMKEWGELFTDDAVFAVEQHDQRWEAQGREAIVAKMREMVGIETIGDGREVHVAATMHIGGQPVIDLDGDTATAWWDLAVFRRAPEGITVQTVGRYYARLAVDGDRWRFTHRTSVHSGATVPPDLPLTPSA